MVFFESINCTKLVYTFTFGRKIVDHKTINFLQDSVFVGYNV